MPRFIEPQWPAPARVQALCTTRQGGGSASPWDSFNLGDHVGDSPAAVTANRAVLAASIAPATHIQWLEQVHGTEVVEAGQGDTPVADACWTRTPGIACAVMTADCLPVLFASADGSVVAAAHAGWRGLQAGVLEATLGAMGGQASGILAWLGPAIGPRAFEVGPEVREAFVSRAAQASTCFTPSAGRPGHFLADIYQLARQRLAGAGVTRIFGGEFCTFSDDARFFSYRRDGQTGRMASLIWIP